MAEQGELQAHGIAADGLATMANAVQKGVTEVGDQLRRKRRERVFSQVFDERVGLVAFALLGTGLLGRGNVGEVAYQLTFYF